MLNRFYFTILCLLSCVLLQAQHPHEEYYSLGAPLTKKQAKEFLKKYQAMPDTLPCMDNYDSVAEQILLNNEATRLEIVPNIMDTITAQVLIKEAYNGYRAPIYKTVPMEVLTTESYKLLEIVPAIYDSISEKIMTKTSQLVWTKNKAYKGKLTPQCYYPDVQIDTCLWRLVTKAPTYATISKRVLKSPTTTREIQIPAQYITLQKQIVDTEATAKNPLQGQAINIAAEYKTVKKAVVKVPTTTREVEVPAEYTTIRTYKLVKSGQANYPGDYNPPYFGPPKTATTTPQKSLQPGYAPPRSVPPTYYAPTNAQANMPNNQRSTTQAKAPQTPKAPPIEPQMVEAKVTSSKIAEIQQALTNRGYDPGPIDNVLGPKTRQALIQFQKDNNFPVGNLNMEVMRVLLDPPAPPDFYSKVQNKTALDSAYQVMQQQLAEGLINTEQYNQAIHQYNNKRAELLSKYDSPALFAYGKDSIAHFISRKMQYPAEARKYGIEGTVMVKFVVDSTGKAVQPSIEQGVSWDLNQAALQIVEQMPLWKPAIIYGEPSSEEQLLPIKFSLNDKQKPEPITIDGEKYKPIIENEFLTTQQNPLSTFSIDVDNAAYSNARNFIQNGQLPPPDAVRTEEFINYFTYDYPQPQDQHPFSISTEMQRCPWNEQHHLLLIGLQGRNIDLKDIPPANLVFLLDVSGSMSDEMPLLKKSLTLLVEQMRPQDRISIVVYAGASGLVLPPTNGNEQAKIIAALENLHAGGSTAGGAGIKLAYQTARENFLPNGNNRIILVTDGDFNVGITAESELTALIEKERESGVFLTCLGMGRGNYQDARMELLADKGNGNYAYIDGIREAQKVLVAQMGGTLFTIAKDVKLQIDFNPNNIKGYRLVGYENRVMAAQDFDNDKKDAGELGAGHSVTALYEIILHADSKAIPKADTLKYPPTQSKYKQGSGDLLTVKMRYKAPSDSTSQLIEKTLGRMDLRKPISDNFKWASSVAAFALCLRNSQFKGKATFDSILKKANEAIGNDPKGYRKEFISLVEQTQQIK
jgi:Ca-activated chloride channel family protein